MTREFPKNSGPENIARPTVGRIVHIFNFSVDFGGNINPAEPLAAIVAKVDPDSLTINAGVFTASGGHVGAFAVPHASDPALDASNTYWDWMPYQKGQAAKTEALEQKLAGAQGGPSTIAPSEVLSDNEVLGNIADFDHDGNLKK